MNLFSVLSLVLSLALVSSILVAASRRNLIGRFRWFCVYLVFSFVRDSVRLVTAVKKTRIAYFYAYWSSEPIGIALSLVALLATFFLVFRGFKAFRWFPWALRGTIGLALCYSIWKAIAHPPLQASMTISFIIATELTDQYVLTAICLLFLVLIPLFGLPFQVRESWIVLGFGVASSCFLVSGMLRSIFGTKYLWLSENLPAVAYLFCEVIWLIGVSRAESRFYQEREISSSLSPDEMIAVLDRYIEVAKKGVKDAWSKGHQ